MRDVSLGKKFRDLPCVQSYLVCVSLSITIQSSNPFILEIVTRSIRKRWEMFLCVKKYRDAFLSGGTDSLYHIITLSHIITLYHIASFFSSITCILQKKKKVEKTKMNFFYVYTYIINVSRPKNCIFFVGFLKR